MAILAALSFNRAEFGLYAHTRVAGDAGFDLGQVRDAGEGRCPKGLSEREVGKFMFLSSFLRGFELESRLFAFSCDIWWKRTPWISMKTAVRIQI